MISILKSFYHKFNKNYQEQYLLRRELAYFGGSKKILDVGCGEGEFLKLSPKKIVGIDQNRKSVSLCKKQGLNVVYGKANSLPFEKDFFDGVHCAHVIEHLYPNDAFKMLREVSRVLKKNGIFVLSSPLLWHGFYNDFTHVKPYNPESIERYLCHDGFQKTFSDFPARFSRVDLKWRFRPLPFFGKAGYIIVNYLYQFGLHSWQKDGYTLVLKKLTWKKL